MKSLACKDMGVTTDCPFVATGETDEEVMNKMTEHAGQSHAADMEKMKAEMSEEDMMMKMKTAIKDV